jgi:hypothetical protein
MAENQSRVRPIRNETIVRSSRGIKQMEAIRPCLAGYSATLARLCFRWLEARTDTTRGRGREISATGSFSKSSPNNSRTFSFAAFKTL